MGWFAKIAECFRSEPWWFSREVWKEYKYAALLERCTSERPCPHCGGPLEKKHVRALWLSRIPVIEFRCVGCGNREERLSLLADVSTEAQDKAVADAKANDYDLWARTPDDPGW